MSDRINQTLVVNGRDLRLSRPFSSLDSFKITNLDLQDSRPNGGPLHNPSSNYVHKFTSRNTYIEYIKRYR
jgi:hypothetical protein